MKALQPHGVDPNLVGTWQLPLKNSPWVLTINADGTYAFRSDAHDGVQAHAGSFAASNGAWTMKAKTGYAGSGNYLYQAPNIFLATSQLGAVSWLRPVENHVLVVPPAAAAGLPERLQELLGYNIHPPFIGYVDGRHPRKLIDEVEAVVGA